MDVLDRRLALKLLSDDLDRIENEQAPQDGTILLSDSRAAIRYMRAEISAAQAIERGPLTTYGRNFRIFPNYPGGNSHVNTPSQNEDLGSSFSDDAESIISDSTDENHRPNSDSSLEDPSFEPSPTEVLSSSEDGLSSDEEIGDNSLTEEHVKSSPLRSRRDTKKEIIDLTQDDFIDLTEADNKRTTCVSCFDMHEATFSAGPCDHQYCRACLRQMLIIAAKNEPQYPPRCCGNPIKTDGVASKVLSKKELHEYNEKSVEWSTKNRLYCANRKCARFIPPANIEDEHGTCKSCAKITHVTCHLLAHPNVDCPKDEALQGVLKLARSRQWQRCSKCRSMVERTEGCPHITCWSVHLVSLKEYTWYAKILPSCGNQFCYTCGGPWGRCGCRGRR